MLLTLTNAMQSLASHLFYSIEIIPYLFYSEAFAIKPVLLTQSTNRRSKNQLKDNLLNVLCHYISIFYLLLLTSFVVRTPGPFGSAWTAINSRYDWTNQRLANSTLGRLWFVKPGGRGGIRTHSPIGNGFIPCPRFELGIYMFEILDYLQMGQLLKLFYFYSQLLINLALEYTTSLNLYLHKINNQAQNG